MDRRKTGQLIADARKEQGLTQKELAAKLHVSDRAVSKWERGSGFPDVSLLEPLAEALELGVLDLLRGERGEEANACRAAEETVRALEEARKCNEAEERRAKRTLAAALAGVLLVLALLGWIRVPLHHTVLAGVYENGVQTAVTEVEVAGYLRLKMAGLIYCGRIKVPLSKSSLEEKTDLRYEIPIEPGGKATSPTSKRWHGNLFPAERPFVGETFCLTPGMRDFAFTMTDGHVVATTPAMYVRCATAAMAALPEQIS